MTQGENLDLINQPDLHVDGGRRPPGDPACPQPIGGRTVGRADLIDPHHVGLVVQTAHLLPLRTGRQQRIRIRH